MSTRTTIYLAGFAITMEIAAGMLWWAVEPSDWLLMVPMTALLPTIWLVASILRRFDISVCGAGQNPAEFASSIAMGAFLMTLMMGKNIAEELAILDVAMADRVVGVTIGAFLMTMGNMIPKVLTPTSRMRCDPARAQAVQRYAGRVFVLAGLAITIGWIAAPTDVASIVMLVAGGVSLILVIPRKLAMYFTRNSMRLERDACEDPSPAATAASAVTSTF